MSRARLALATFALLTFATAAVPGASAACEQNFFPLWDYANDCVEDVKDEECKQVRFVGCDIVGGPFCPASAYFCLA